MPAQWSGSGLQSLRVEALRARTTSRRNCYGGSGSALVLHLDAGPPVARDASLRTLGQIEAHIDWAQKLATTIRENDDSPARTTPSPPSGVRAGCCPSQRLQESTRALGDEQRHHVPQTAMGLLGDAEASFVSSRVDRSSGADDLYQRSARVSPPDALKDRHVRFRWQMSTASLSIWQPLGSSARVTMSCTRHFPGWRPGPPTWVTWKLWSEMPCGSSRERSQFCVSGDATSGGQPGSSSESCEPSRYRSGYRSSTLKEPIPFLGCEAAAGLTQPPMRCSTRHSHDSRRCLPPGDHRRGVHVVRPGTAAPRARRRCAVRFAALCRSPATHGWESARRTQRLSK